MSHYLGNIIVLLFVRFSSQEMLRIEKELFPISIQGRQTHERIVGVERCFECPKPESDAGDLILSMCDAQKTRTTLEIVSSLKPGRTEFLRSFSTYKDIVHVSVSHDRKLISVTERRKGSSGEWEYVHSVVSTLDSAECALKLPKENERGQKPTFGYFLPNGTPTVKSLLRVCDTESIEILKLIEKKEKGKACIKVDGIDKVVANAMWHQWDPFSGYFSMLFRINGQPHIRVLDYAAGGMQQVQMPVLLHLSPQPPKTVLPPFFCPHGSMDSRWHIRMLPIFHEGSQNERNYAFCQQIISPNRSQIEVSIALLRTLRSINLTIPLINDEEAVRDLEDLRVSFMFLHGMIAVVLPGVFVHYIDVARKDHPPQYLMSAKCTIKGGPKALFSTLPIRHRVELVFRPGTLEVYTPEIDRAAFLDWIALQVQSPNPDNHGIKCAISILTAHVSQEGYENKDKLKRIIERNPRALNAQHFAEYLIGSTYATCSRMKFIRDGFLRHLLPFTHEESSTAVADNPQQGMPREESTAVFEAEQPEVVLEWPSDCSAFHPRVEVKTDRVRGVQKTHHWFLIEEGSPTKASPTKVSFTPDMRKSGSILWRLKGAKKDPTPFEPSSSSGKLSLKPSAASLDKTISTNPEEQYKSMLRDQIRVLSPAMLESTAAQVATAYCAEFKNAICSLLSIILRTNLHPRQQLLALHILAEALDEIGYPQPRDFCSAFSSSARHVLQPTILLEGLRTGLYSLAYEDAKKHSLLATIKKSEPKKGDDTSRMSVPTVHQCGWAVATNLIAHCSDDVRTKIDAMLRYDPAAVLQYHSEVLAPPSQRLPVPANTPLGASVRRGGTKPVVLELGFAPVDNLFEGSQQPSGFPSANAWSSSVFAAAHSSGALIGDEERCTLAREELRRLYEPLAANS